MREIDITGCPIIGSGAFGKVFRLDGDTVVKVYDDPANLPLIQTEQARSRRAFIKGIATAIPFGVAKIGETYGSMFELIDARNCNDYLSAHPQKADELIAEYASFIKKLHEVHADAGEFPDIREEYCGYLDDMRDCLPAELYEELRKFVQSMPKSNGLVHGDIQMKNIMLTNGEMLLIDMSTLSAGNELFELAGLYRTYILFYEHNPEGQTKFLGLSAELARRVYYGTAERLGIDGDSLEIQILGVILFLHVLVIELSQRESLIVSQTIAKLVELLHG